MLSYMVFGTSLNSYLSFIICVALDLQKKKTISKNVSLSLSYNYPFEQKSETPCNKCSVNFFFKSILTTRSMMKYFIVNTVFNRVQEKSLRYCKFLENFICHVYYVYLSRLLYLYKTKIKFKKPTA